MSEQKELSTQDIMIAKLKFDIYQSVSNSDMSLKIEDRIKSAQKIYDFVTSETSSNVVITMSKVKKEQFEAMMAQFQIESQKTSY